MPVSFRRRLPVWLLIGLCLVGIFSVSAYRVFGRAPAPQTELPTDGWTVCAVGVEEPVPGLPDLRQMFNLCHANGWELRAYCLQPGMPAPPVGVMCSQDGGVFWCGDGVQMLQNYVVLQTPEATPTPTQTATATITSTATPTLTITPSPTGTTTLTLTPTLETVTLTAEWQQITVEASETATIQSWSTVGIRPRAGGPGNAGLVYGLLVGVFALLVWMGWRLWRTPKKEEDGE